MTGAVVTALLSAICFVESGHKPNAINFYDGGSASYGKCQIKLSTARLMGFRGGVTELWLNPAVNSKYAERYLRYQLRRYRWDLSKAISAYSCGTACNNQKYVDKVFRAMGELR
jgi:hypothetical protein